jgi:hypothetical protein
MNLSLFPTRGTAKPPPPVQAILLRDTTDEQIAAFKETYALLLAAKISGRRLNFEVNKKCYTFGSVSIPIIMLG